MTAKQVRLLICKLSAMLAGMLEREKIIRAEDRAVYEYGFQITIANITNALIVLLIGLVTHSIVRVLIFYTVFLSMRMICGGFHAKTYTRCFCLFGTTCLLCTVASYGVMEFTNVLSAAVISAVLQGMCLYQMAPVENENHPLSKAEKKKFRSYSMIVFVFWVLIMFLMYTNKYYMIAAVISVTLLSVSILMLIAKQKRGGETDGYEEERS